ncbi:hypothetical protein EDC04DRAFT_1370814 [Pisolithus marmoratus]|nr:hypothetical protein EDC04DRAFT_1370814 [Pisolithus marmoratus]
MRMRSFLLVRVLYSFSPARAPSRVTAPSAQRYECSVALEMSYALKRAYSLLIDRVMRLLAPWLPFQRNGAYHHSMPLIFSIFSSVCRSLFIHLECAMAVVVFHSEQRLLCSRFHRPRIFRAHVCAVLVGGKAS